MHQIELTSFPIENILLNIRLSERLKLNQCPKRVRIIEGTLYRLFQNVIFFPIRVSSEVIALFMSLTFQGVSNFSSSQQQQKCMGGNNYYEPFQLTW